MKVIYIYCVLSFLLGCNSKKEKVDIFFSNLDKTLSANERNEIRKCDDIGCLTLFMQSKAKDKLVKAYDSLSEDLNYLLLDSFKIENLYDRHRVLIVAYQKKLKGQVINYFDIKNEIVQFDISEEKNYNMNVKTEVLTQREIAQKNFEKFEIGDTVNLLYPLERSGNRKNVYFNNFYYKKDYRDTLFLKCILIKKKKEDIKEFHLAPGEFYFWLKIIEARNNELSIVEKEYRKGNTIVLPVYDYGRNIDK